MKKVLILLILSLLLLPLFACQKECPHDWVLDFECDPTCTTAGYKEYRCSLCGETYRTSTGMATGHEPKLTYPETVTAATCTSSGVAKQRCAVCGEEYTVTLPKKEHNYVDHICTFCGEADQALFFTDMNAEHRSGSEYITFSANLNNYSGKKVEFVQVTLELFDSDGNIIDSDWTYAVGSEGLKDHAKSYFDIFYRGVSYYDIDAWGLYISDYDIGY